jgi:DNA-binding GntR family transcriptional regulator
LKAAQNAGGSALVVGLLLWYLQGMKKYPDDLVVTRARAKETFGISKERLYWGLNNLESAGLIRSSRGVGRAIRVTIINPQTETESQQPTSYSNILTAELSTY